MLHHHSNQVMHAQTLAILTPALLTNGGNKEILDLASRIEQRGVQVRLISLWQFADTLQTQLPVTVLASKTRSKLRAVLQLPAILYRFFRFGMDHPQCTFVFTHYSTFIPAMMTLKHRKIFFMQGLEWKFIRPMFLQTLMARLIEYLTKRQLVVTTSLGLSSIYKSQFKTIITTEYPIWANAYFADTSVQERSIDIVFISRHGSLKRLDLYVDVLHKIKAQSPHIKIAAITPQADTLKALGSSIDLSFVLPSIEEMKAIYSRSKTFLMLSDSEGFSLPPLEAMGAGCVPICRDNGGSRNYLLPQLAELLLPLERTAEQICEAIDSLLKNTGRLERLSKTCREMFQQGANESEHKKARAIDEIIAHLNASEELSKNV
jgi:glycosyltransferase involved in cell wall biosynthesis